MCASGATIPPLARDTLKSVFKLASLLEAQSKVDAECVAQRSRAERHNSNGARADTVR